MSYNTQTNWNKLKEDNELAFFRADVCLGSPQSFSLEEKAAICEDMEATNAAIDAALRADFSAMPPALQARMLDLLQEADPGNFGWWLSTCATIGHTTAAATMASSDM